MGLVAAPKAHGLLRCRRVGRFSMGLSSWLHLETVVYCCSNESGRKAARLQMLHVFLGKSQIFPLSRPFNWQWQQAKSSLLKVWQPQSSRALELMKEKEIFWNWVPVGSQISIKRHGSGASQTGSVKRSLPVQMLPQTSLWQKHLSLKGQGPPPRKGTLLPFQSAF